MFLASVCSFQALGASAWAANAKDLIVRYREPQNNFSQAFNAAWKAGLKGVKSHIQILNASEGLVELSFSSIDDAILARARLLASDEVESVAPNLLYRPALHLKWKDADPTAEVIEVPPFLSPLGMISILATGIPDVHLPPDHVQTGVDPLAAKDWALRKINLPTSNTSTSNRPVIAAVTDTGIDYNHEDLSGGLWRKRDNPRFVGYDFAHDNDKPYDVVHFDLEGCLADPGCPMGIGTENFLVNPGHGTHCAGHVGAVANNSLGIKGIGAGSPIMGLKFFYDYGEENAGSGDDAAAIKAIDFAIKNGAKVISASWGGRNPRKEAEKSELKKALIRAQKAGVIFVVAAGNDTVNQDKDPEPSYPAAYDLDNLIVVAASDKEDGLADFSNFGAKSVHLAAPGVKILSTTVGSKYDDVVAKYKDSNGNPKTLDWDGTSMATPIVAGAVVAVWNSHPSENYHQIRDRILRNVRKVSKLSGKVSTGGVLDVAAAIR